jgi:hypothetical protein
MSSKGVVMFEVRSDLLIRVDTAGEKLIFSLSKKNGQHSPTMQAFTVEVDFEELRSRGPDGAEKLIGECVLGFFDRLTDGRLDLPKHY